MGEQEKRLEAAVEAILFTMGESVEEEALARAIGLDAAGTRKIVHRLMERNVAAR